MPYETVNELPADLQASLPREAQEIYLSAYNEAWEFYEDPNRRLGNGSREMAARMRAWEAVRREFEKNKDGSWVRIYTRV